MQNVLSARHYIIESLYCEALILYDEACATFIQHDTLDRAPSSHEMMETAHSFEGRRTIHRMRNALVWLRQQRVASNRPSRASKLSEIGKLYEDLLSSDVLYCNPRNLILLSEENAKLVKATCRLLERLRFIGQSGQTGPTPQASPSDWPEQIEMRLASSN